MSAVLTVRVTEEVKDQLEALADATGRSKSWIAFEAIKQYIELESWQIGEIKAAIKEANAGDFATETEADAVKKMWRSKVA